jgi:hypothetical protein
VPQNSACRKMKNARKILLSEVEGKMPIAKPRRRWQANMMTELKEMG